MKGTCTLYIAVIMITVAVFSLGCRKQSAELASEPAGDQVEAGMALVEEWKCSYCHTPEIEGPEGRAIPDPDRLLSGHPSDEEIPELPDMIMTSPEYMEFLDNLDTTVWATDNRIVFTANLTPDDETGIGTWTEEMFIATIRSGQHAGVGKRIKYPMPWQELAELDDAELAAIYAYLRSVKPVSNKVPESIVLFR
jgi:cytochrome c